MQEAIIGDDFTVSYGKKFVHHLFVKNYIRVYSVYYSVSQVKSRIPGDIESFFSWICRNMNFLPLGTVSVFFIYSCCSGFCSLHKQRSS